MKSQIKAGDVNWFLGELESAIQYNKEELDRVETVVWEKENSLALFWNKRFGKWYTVHVYDKSDVIKCSIRYGFQRWGIQDKIEQQESLKVRLLYALTSNSYIILEDNDYKLLKGSK